MVWASFLGCAALRLDNSCDFEALRSRRGQAEAILVAYDLMVDQLKLIGHGL